MNRIDYNMPAAEYHALKRMSSSAVRAVNRSPAHFVEWQNGERKQSDAMLLGEVIHLGMLQPELWASTIVVYEKPTSRKADDKAAFEKHMVELRAAGKLPILQDMKATAERVINAITSHQQARSLLEGAMTEVSLLWTDPKFGIDCKTRMDAISPLEVIVDLKSTSDASPGAFARSAASYYYHAQAAFYWTAYEVVMDKSPAAFVWIAAETEPPYGVAVYSLREDAYFAGLAQVNKAMATYAEAQKSGLWPSYPQEITPLALPRWALIGDAA